MVKKLLTWASVLALVTIGYNMTIPPNYYTTKVEHKLLEQMSLNPKYKPVIQLKTMDNKFFCSGYVVDRNYVVTAAHCLQGFYKGSIKVVSEEGIEVVSKTVAFNRSIDLGVITGDYNNFMNLSIKVADSGLKTSHLPLIYNMCGYPGGQNQMVCNQAIPIGLYNGGLRLNGFLRPGMSGGPVLNENGEAIGVNSAIGTDFSIVSPLQGLTGLAEGLQ